MITALDKKEIIAWNVKMVLQMVLYKIIVFNYKLGNGKCFENIEFCLTQKSDQCF